MACSIGHFHTEYYQLYINTYAFNGLLMESLGENERQKWIKIAFELKIIYALTGGDYSKALKEEFDLEIQSGAFCFNQTLSI